MRKARREIIKFKSTLPSIALFFLAASAYCQTTETTSGIFTDPRDGEYAWIRHTGFFDNTIGRVLNRKEPAFPVRCVKDAEGFDASRMA